MLQLPQTALPLQSELTVTLTYRLSIIPGVNPFDAIQDLLVSLQSNDVKPQALKAAVIHTRNEDFPNSNVQILRMKKPGSQEKKSRRKK